MSHVSTSAPSRRGAITATKAEITKDAPGQYEEVLQPGMAICVESYLGPYAGGEGVKLEDQVLITENGIEVLSTLPFQEDWL
jgi:Xaa-Pro aminopeptidase